MEEILQLLKEFNIITVLLRLLAAALMGGLIGAERGRHGRAAGLRTHILICIGAATTALTGIYLSEILDNTGDLARLSAQVISGIGFLGAGTILVRNSSVITGLTTAAGMWATAAIGVAVGYGFFFGAIVATLICILSVTLLSRLERKRKNTLNVYIELDDISATEQVINQISALEAMVSSYDIIPPKSGHTEHVGIAVMLADKDDFLALKEALCVSDSVIMTVGNIGG